MCVYIRKNSMMGLKQRYIDRREAMRNALTPHLIIPLVDIIDAYAMKSK